MRTGAVLLTLALMSFVHVDAQQRQASPEGTTSTQVNGRWIDIVYGKPILRGRTNIFGSGADYGKTLFDGGPVWRAGANVSTRLRNEMPLEVGGKRIPPGELVMLIDLKSEKDWTFKAERVSAAEGNSVWTGTVHDKSVEGKLIWTRNDGTVLTYTFKGNKLD